MAEDAIVFDGSFEAVGKQFELHPRGTVFLCPVCGVRLNAVLNWEDARRLGTHPGVSCPTDVRHVFRMFNLRRPDHGASGEASATVDGCPF